MKKAFFKMSLLYCMEEVYLFVIYTNVKDIEMHLVEAQASGHAFG